MAFASSTSFHLTQQMGQCRSKAGFSHQFQREILDIVINIKLLIPNRLVFARQTRSARINDLAKTWSLAEEPWRTRFHFESSNSVHAGQKGWQLQSFSAADRQSSFSHVPRVLLHSTGESYFTSPGFSTTLKKTLFEWNHRNLKTPLTYTGQRGNKSLLTATYFCGRTKKVTLKKFSSGRTGLVLLGHYLYVTSVSHSWLTSLTPLKQKMPFTCA